LEGNNRKIPSALEEQQFVIADDGEGDNDAASSNAANQIDDFQSSELHRNHLI
jgi:hypothetical protein